MPLLEPGETVLGGGGKEMPGHGRSSSLSYNSGNTRLPATECKRRPNIHSDHSFQEKSIMTMWVGGTDQFQEGNWTWTDCNPWNFTRWGNRVGHLQPDNSIAKDGNGEDCLLTPSSKSPNIDWADAACNTKERKFVCSKSLCASGETLSLICSDELFFFRNNF